MHEKVSEHILQVAGQLFAERGYRAVTVREICRRAGVNISAVNYYFGSKETLYLETVRFAARQCTRNVPIVTWTETDPPASRLRQFIHGMLHRVVRDEEPSWPAQLLMVEIVRPTRACQRFVREFVRPNFQALLDILQQFLPRPCPEKTLYRLAFSIVGQCLYYRMCRSVMSLLAGPQAPALLDLESLTEHITNFSLAGIQGIARPLRRRRRPRYAPATTRGELS